MSYILPEGRIMILKQPISGRYGIPRLMAYITANSSRFGWDGVETISVITFNRFRTRCKIISCDKYGVTLTVRILHSGNFKVLLDDDLLPETINKSELESLMRYGTLSIDAKTFEKFRNGLNKSLKKS